MDIALAAAGIIVTLLVVVGMVLIVPQGAERVDGTASNLSLRPGPRGAAEGGHRGLTARPHAFGSDCADN
jgi:hypothetical protein